MIRLTGRLHINLVAASAVLAGLLGLSAHADAAARHGSNESRSRSVHHHVSHSRHHASPRASVHRVLWRGRRGGTWLQCVPYARRVSGIELRGNADTWWEQANGRYDRGQTPQEGAVLSFQSNRHMELGHVAVVSKTVSPREILITQANWPTPGQRFGNISKSVSVIDVSPDNDWTAVRVERGHSGSYGAVYPTNGFIYGRSTADTLMAAEMPTKSQTAPAGISAGWAQTVQLASAPNYGGPAIADSAPDRNLR